MKTRMRILIPAVVGIMLTACTVQTTASRPSTDVVRRDGTGHGGRLSVMHVPRFQLAAYRTPAAADSAEVVMRTRILQSRGFSAEQAKKILGDSRLRDIAANTLARPSTSVTVSRPAKCGKTTAYLAMNGQLSRQLLVSHQMTVKWCVRTPKVGKPRVVVDGVPHPRTRITTMGKGQGWDVSQGTEDHIDMPDGSRYDATILVADASIMNIGYQHCEFVLKITIKTNGTAKVDKSASHC